MTLLAGLEAERDALVTAPAPAHPHAGKIKTLTSSEASGRSSRPCWSARSSSAVSPTAARSRASLAPCPFQSGGLAREQGIGKAGNAKARTTMLELAWLWRRLQPDSALSQWFQQRVGALRGQVRRIAAAALARKLLVALWRYLETGLVPAGALLKP